MLSKLKTFLNHERYQVLAIFGILILLIWFFGCQSKVASLQNPSLRISREELQAEVQGIIDQADIRFAQLDKEDELRQLLIDQALLWTKTGTINPVGLVMPILTILGAGATVDNVRRRKVEKANNKNT